PPRPPPPPPAQRLDSGSSHSSGHPLHSSPSQSGQSDRALEHQQQAERMKEMADQERRRVEEEARRRQYGDEQERRAQEAYNASLPNTRPPLAKQELGGYGASDPSMNDRYKPSRPAPPAPGAASRQPGGPPLTAQSPEPP